MVAEMIMALAFGTVMAVSTLFDKILEDELGLDFETKKNWAEILLICLKKMMAPKNLEQLRGISLLNIMPKWFMLCVMDIVDVIPEPQVWH